MKQLVECARNKKWAGGVTLWSDEVRNNKRILPGKNLAGTILEQERDNILNKVYLEQYYDDNTPPPLEGDDITEQDADPEQHNETGK